MQAPIFEWDVGQLLIFGWWSEKVPDMFPTALHATAYIRAMTMSEFETLRSCFAALSPEVEGLGFEPFAVIPDRLVARRDARFDNKPNPGVIRHAADCVFTPVARSQATILLS
ncbi:hypothetical protein [Xanthobacter oligotrophicus]|uniref:hypothetical protein n=1 Tax=Xanthobacter oligotrophicus TaxID=2607286 RepID=UPI0011F12D3F|nr:hypothetical protein [Xanthobacter oligotrophicus]MCG5233742.1 hypothetical protein [Xanthobacter oligotrophicus]